MMKEQPKPKFYNEFMIIIGYIFFPILAFAGFLWLDEILKLGVANSGSRGLWRFLPIMAGVIALPIYGAILLWRYMDFVSARNKWNMTRHINMAPQKKHSPTEIEEIDRKAALYDEVTKSEQTNKVQQ